MEIEVASNPNCTATDQFVFQELELPRAIRGIKISERGQDVDCDVMGVTAKGEFVQAFARKVADSGAGFAYIVYGAEWGIRIRPCHFASEPWGLNNPHQTGEPFKIYAYEDILF